MLQIEDDYKNLTLTWKSGGEFICSDATRCGGKPSLEMWVHHHQTCGEMDKGDDNFLHSGWDYYSSHYICCKLTLSERNN